MGRKILKPQKNKITIKFPHSQPRPGDNHYLNVLICFITYIEKERQMVKKKHITKNPLLYNACEKTRKSVKKCWIVLHCVNGDGFADQIH